MAEVFPPAYPSGMSLVAALGLDPLLGDLERLEIALHGSVRTEDQFMTEVASHLMSAGGKRLRPALALCCAYGVQGVSAADDRALSGGVSVELVHLGSLYHDDVIDEADTRRGVPSVNARWSNIVAILAGDFLLARASEISASLGAKPAELLAATIAELCRGQVLELRHLWDTTRTEESYRSAIDGKTAALMSMSCRMGAMVAGASQPDTDALAKFGRHLGMAFQIVDDVLDVTGEESELGKPAGNDLAKGIYTLPVIYELRANDELRDLLGAPLDEPTLEKARSLVIGTGVIDAAMDAARDHAALASSSARDATGIDPQVVEALSGLATALLERTA